jgi:uncharacterized membrane protein YuzA (DUF378 family)
MIGLTVEAGRLMGDLKMAKKYTLKVLDMVLGALLIIGGLNWGFVGLFNVNFVAAIFGDATALTRFIYILVGFAAVYDIVTIKSIWRRWDIGLGKPAHT